MKCRKKYHQDHDGYADRENLLILVLSLIFLKETAGHWLGRCDIANGILASIATKKAYVSIRFDKTSVRCEFINLRLLKITPDPSDTLQNYL